MTCAGLSCLTLDVFFVAYRGASTSRTIACLPVFLCTQSRSLQVWSVARELSMGMSFTHEKAVSRKALTSP
jgi:hypothetical protein